MAGRHEAWTAFTRGLRGGGAGRWTAIAVGIVTATAVATSGGDGASVEPTPSPSPPSAIDEFVPSPDLLAPSATLTPTPSRTASPTPTPTPSRTHSATPTPSPVATPTPTPEPPPTPAGNLLVVADRKDGDSFVASDGVEYRVGLVNTPELSACGGPEAADRTYALLADGFTVEAYSSDNYGRSVARVRTADGTDLGVWLARNGWADDRYLDDFRHEHPAYARELDEAFAAAKAAGVGLWSTCWAPPPPEPSGAQHTGRTGQWPCHPAYRECLPDGPDLDCAEVGHQVVLLGNDDPYRLDGNSTTRTDGTGCDTYPAWSASATYPYY